MKAHQQEFYITKGERVMGLIKNTRRDRSWINPEEKHHQTPQSTAMASSNTEKETH
jgi:hypothetical protein